MKELETLRSELMSAVEKAGSLDDLEKIRVSALGKKGRITELMKGLGGMDPDSRKQAGQSLNALKAEIADAIEAKKRASADSELEARLARESVDVTLPVRPESEGYIHPISQTIDEVVAILGEMGLGVAEGPDIENDCTISRRSIFRPIIRHGRSTIPSTFQARAMMTVLSSAPTPRPFKFVL